MNGGDSRRAAPRDAAVYVAGRLAPKDLEGDMEDGLDAARGIVHALLGMLALATLLGTIALVFTVIGG